MSLNVLETPNPHSKMKLVQSLEEIDYSPNNQTSKKLLNNPMNKSFTSENFPNVPLVLNELQNNLKTLKLYHKKPKNLDSNEELRSKALAVIDQNNKLNSLLESDIALQYLESQDISPKQGIKSLNNSKREMINANVQLNKKLFQRFFLDNYPEKLPANKALESLYKELSRLKGNSFDKENLNYYKTSHSFIEIQSAEFIKHDENTAYDKLVEDYKGLASENLRFKQENQILHEKMNKLLEENNTFKRANSMLLNELETLDRERKDYKESLLTKPVDFNQEYIKNEEFKLLDEKITQLLNENAKLKQMNDEQEKTLEILLKGPRDSSIVVSQNVEKIGGFSLVKSRFDELKEKEQYFIPNTKNSQKNSKILSNGLKDSEGNHGRCNKIIEDLKNELMEAHLCIADLENKIKSFLVKKHCGKDVKIKQYDVSLNLCESGN